MKIGKLCLNAWFHSLEISLGVYYIFEIGNKLFAIGFHFLCWTFEISYLNNKVFKPLTQEQREFIMSLKDS